MNLDSEERDNLTRRYTTNENLKIAHCRCVNCIIISVHFVPVINHNRKLIKDGKNIKYINA
jgi:hypothetical protein